MKKINITMVFFDGTSCNMFNFQDSINEFCNENNMLPHEISHEELTLFLKKKINILDVKMQSYMNYFTNIYWLNKLYKNSFDQIKLEYQKSIFLEGGGTNAGEQDCMFAVAFGTGRKGILAKTDKSLCLLENAFVE